MRSLRVYDEQKHAVWRSKLEPGEVALFHVDAKTGRARNRHGRPLESHWLRECLVFDALDEAVAYAEQFVRDAPSCACRIFDAESEAPIATVVNTDARPEDDPRRMVRRAAWGLLLIAVGLFGIWIDWLFDWFYVLGVVIGVKFLTVGFVRLGEGLSYYLASRKRGIRSAPRRAR